MFLFLYFHRILDLPTLDVLILKCLKCSYKKISVYVTQRKRILLKYNVNIITLLDRVTTVATTNAKQYDKRKTVRPTQNNKIVVCDKMNADGLIDKSVSDETTKRQNVSAFVAAIVVAALYEALLIKRK